jgi:homoserine O-acetyltransferase/O-succinyltransferase
MNATKNSLRALVQLLLLIPTSSLAANYPTPEVGDFVLRNFEFRSGDSLPEVRIHYRTLGKPERDSQGVVRNAVFLLHGTTGSSEQFLRPEFAEELFGQGQLLDPARYYIIIPDNLGHGKSTRPSDGLRARFPKYGYRDMIAAQHRLLTEGLGVNHLRLVIGTSMGGMHTWLWGQTYPEFVDALMPLACLPTQISGRNRVWRRIIMDAIKTDPEWQDGDYKSQPGGLRTALKVSYLMSSNPVLRWKAAPTLADVDKALDEHVADRFSSTDANNMLYAYQASEDYDPGPGLEKITAPLVAINFSDDLINPPELGILEREIKRVPRGRAIIIPLSDKTQGHATHTYAAIWKEHLAELLQQSEERRADGQKKSEQ